MNSDDWVEIVGAIGLLALVITVVTVTLVQLGSIWRARVSVRREQEYRALAEQVLATQSNSERQLSVLTVQVGEISGRLESIERILKEVE